MEKHTVRPQPLAAQPPLLMLQMGWLLEPFHRDMVACSLSALPLVLTVLLPLFRVKYSLFSLTPHSMLRVIS
jgi:hypothetical protein